MSPPSIPVTSSSHPSDPIPQEPSYALNLPAGDSPFSQSPTTSSTSQANVNDDTFSFNDSGSATPPSDFHSSDESYDEQPKPQNTPRPTRRRASTLLVSQDSDDARKFLGATGAATEMVQKACCGGGCCMLKQLVAESPDGPRRPVRQPDNDAFRSLHLRVEGLGRDSELTGLVDLPEKTLSFERIEVPSHPASEQQKPTWEENLRHPPNFVQPHPPYDVFSAPLWHARELTKPGAEKRTFHFDIDVSDYPAESGDVEFVVGGAIGVCAPNPPGLVDKVLDLLAVPRFVRDRPVLLKTTKGRWPTIWGDDEARELVTTRRELLTWCADLQSYPPTKQVFRLLAQHADDEDERKILEFMASAQGQGAFCDLRTGAYITVVQLLAAFPSSHPPLDHLLSCLQQLMPRFYSLSQDPTVSHWRDGSHQRKIIEIAVTVHESKDWSGVNRTGIGSGFLEGLARKLIDAEEKGIDPKTLDLRIPMFRGLMANPLAREFVTDGPMLLIGAGVGIAPFRGFVHRRLKSANCANKVWVLQGVRDSLVDELYSGDWGVHEAKVKKVVQSRKAQGRYVQDEVRNQADLVWFVINALDGRIFVCGSSKGMGEGVEKALRDVAMAKGRLNESEATSFWEDKKTAGQYIAETW